MGITVQVDLPKGIDLELVTAVRRGLKLAGEEILAASDVLAPREPEPKHGVHMTETGFTRIMLDPAGDAVMVGYEAYWSLIQNEDLTYHHPHGGQAKFLDIAFIGGAPRAMETVAATVREVLK